jgi:hypothetical protein
MNDIKAKLDTYDDLKLIDIVKNYRQYGYDETLKATVLDILNERGIRKEDLMQTGNLSNTLFDNADILLKSYKTNAQTAFWCYIGMVICTLITSFVSQETVVYVTNKLSWGLFFSFFYYLCLSFFNQFQFYKIIKKDMSSWDILIYFFIGLPFYALLYFFFRERMESDLKGVR